MADKDRRNDEPADISNEEVSGRVRDEGEEELDENENKHEDDEDERELER